MKLYHGDYVRNRIAEKVMHLILIAHGEKIERKNESVEFRSCFINYDILCCVVIIIDAWKGFTSLPYWHGAGLSARGSAAAPQSNFGDIDLLSQL